MKKQARIKMLEEMFHDCGSVSGNKAEVPPSVIRKPAAPRAGLPKGSPVNRTGMTVQE